MADIKASNLDGITKGDTSSRPALGNNGDIYINTQTGFLEIYSSTYGWEQIGAPASVVTGVTATDQPSGRAYNNGQTSVAFTPGTVIGRSYTVTSSPGSYTGTGSSSPVTVTGLQSSTQYTYTVVASNNYGTSSASSASAGVTATTVPQAPSLTAVAGNTTADLTITAGATGGSAITQYTITSNPSTTTQTTSSSPYTFTGLTNGTAYTFTATATNANGTSLASSASNSITPSIPVFGAYEPLATITVPSGGAANVSFVGIPQTYTHLQIRMIARCDRAVSFANSVYGRFNSDSTVANYYDMHQIYGDGTSAVGYAYSGGANAFFGAAYGSSTTTNVFSASIIDILDYTNTNKYKTVRALTGNESNSGNTNSSMYFSSSLWMSTNAINSIQIITTGAGNSYNFTANSQFALYGIKG